WKEHKIHHRAHPSGGPATSTYGQEGLGRGTPERRVGAERPPPARATGAGSHRPPAALEQGVGGSLEAGRRLDGGRTLAGGVVFDLGEDVGTDPTPPPAGHDAQAVEHGDATGDAPPGA